MIDDVYPEDAPVIKRRHSTFQAGLSEFALWPEDFPSGSGRRKLSAPAILRSPRRSPTSILAYLQEAGTAAEPTPWPEEEGQETMQAAEPKLASRLVEIAAVGEHHQHGSVVAAVGA